MLSLEIARIINDERQSEIEARLLQRGLLEALAERATQGHPDAVEPAARGRRHEAGSAERAFVAHDRLSVLPREAGE